MLHGKRLGWLAATVAVILIICGLFVFFREDDAITETLSITLGQSNETVRVTNADGEVIPASRGLTLQAGYSVQSSGITPALVEYSDGTKFNLVGTTHIVFDRANAAHVFLERGAVIVSVARRDTSPLIFNTVSATLQVPGTTFDLTANEAITELRVTQGSVKLTQLAGNDSVIVSQGKRVVVDGQSKLVLQDTPRLDDRWEQNFESGLPDNWHGHPFTDNLPSGSRGACKAQHVTKFGSHFQVGMKEPEFHGLFAIRSRTHLHVTYTAETSKYINIFIITRPDRAREHNLAMFKCSSLTPDTIEPGRWKTIAIPLSEFRGKPIDSNDRWTGPSPQTDEIPIWLWLSSPKPDRGLVVDRIWVTPDGPDRVVVEDVE